MDGDVRVDATGRVVADRELRRTFDYFLARLGERPLHSLRADLRDWLSTRTGLSASAQAEALALFDRYVDQLQAAAALSRGVDLQDDLQRLSQLRRDRLGDDLAENWYGDEERYARDTLQRLALGHDSTLSPVQRAEQLAALEHSLPAQTLAERRDATDFQLAVQQTQMLAEQGVAPTARAAERSALWGEEAAERLAALDQADAAWTARLAAYAEQRSAIMANPGLDAATRDRRLLELLAGFTAAEQRRVLALGAAGLLPASN